MVDLGEHLKPDNMSGKSSLGDNSHDNKTINMGDRNHFSEYFDEIVESLKVHATRQSRACRPADPASRPVDLHAKQQKSRQLSINLTQVSW